MSIDFKKIFKKIKEWNNRRIIERDRKPKFLEARLNEVLEFILIKGVVSNIDLIKKLSLTNDEYQTIINIAERNRDYITKVNPKDFGINYKLIDKNLKLEFYTLKNKGLNFILQYRRIKAEQKTSFWMKSATIVIASVAILTFFINYSPAVYVQGNFYCPSTIYLGNNYSVDFYIPISNLGWRATNVYTEVIGKNFIKESPKENYVLAKESPTSLSLRLQLINPKANKSSISIKINYGFLFFNTYTTTKNCYYERGAGNNFYLNESLNS